MNLDSLVARITLLDAVARCTEEASSQAMHDVPRLGLMRKIHTG